VKLLLNQADEVFLFVQSQSVEIVVDWAASESKK